MRLTLYRGKYAAVLYEGGTRKRISLGTAVKAEAEALLAELQANAGRPAGKLVADLYGAYAASKKGQPAHERIETCWKCLKPHFGHLDPERIDDATCRTYAKKRKASTGTIWTELGYLRTALNWAAKRRLTPYAPLVWRPPKPRPNIRYLTHQEARKLLDSAVMPHAKLYIVLALATAGRPHSILDLTWDRVDFAKGIIQLDNPERDQTAKGRATVPMNRTAREALEAAKVGAVTDYVIEWGAKPVGSIKKAIQGSARRAGLDWVTPYVLRHTAAVWMAEGGRPMPEIAQYLGHTDTRVTERVYARFSPDYLRGAAGTLDL